MTTLISFSESDLLRNKIVQPAWYDLEIGMVSDWSPTKAGDSNNCLMETTIIKNADDGTTDYAGVPITLQFNDKPTARGFIEGFFRAFGVEPTANTRYDLKAMAGKHVIAFVENEMYEGRMKNRVNHKYRVQR